jgi:hypothetical protein
MMPLYEVLTIAARLAAFIYVGAFGFFLSVRAPVPGPRHAGARAGMD